MHPTIEKSLFKVRQIVADKKIDKGVSIVNQLIDLAAKVGQAKGGPIVAFGATVGALGIVRNVIGANQAPTSEWNRFIEESKVKEHRSSLAEALNDMGVFDILSMKTFFEEKTRKLVGIEHNGEKLLFTEYGAEEGEGTFANWFHATPNFDFSHLKDAIWKAAGGPILQVQLNRNTSKIDIISSQYDETPYIGSKDPSQFSKDVDIYHSKNIGVAFVLYGPPGGGKTSFVRHYAKSANKRLLILKANSLGRESTLRYVSMLIPDILLLDDIDRDTEGLVAIMELVDIVREKYPKMVIMTTINRIECTNAAVLRPGRLGEKIDFKAPPLNERIDLLKLYMDLYKVDSSKYNLEALAKGMEHEYFTQDYILFVAKKALVYDQTQLMKCVADTVQYLELIGAHVEPPLKS